MSVHDANMNKINKELGIEDDEPIFILRGQDSAATAILWRYRNLRATAELNPPTQEWMDNMNAAIESFQTWQREHKDRVKLAD